MTRHTIASVTFARGREYGPTDCTCGGWSGDSRDFAEHRKASGARVAYVSDPVATPGSPPFQKRLSGKCSRGHEDQWRPRGNGRRDCVACERDLRQQRVAGVA